MNQKGGRGILPAGEGISSWDRVFRKHGREIEKNLAKLARGEKEVSFSKEKR